MPVAPGRPRAPKDPAAAVTELVATCGPMVHAVVRRMVQNPADADDVVQDAFLQAYRHWGAFRGESSPCTWLHAIAVRAAMRRGRRESRRRQATAEYAKALPFAQPRLAQADFPARSTEARELRQEARARVDAAIQDVPDPYRGALILKEIAGMEVAEVAAVLGVKENTVKTRLHRGRLLLRAKMESLDCGVDFPVQDELMCGRCREVFASLDVGADACRSLRGTMMPAALRKRILLLFGSSPRGRGSAC